jgi:hypothetical protein
MLQSFFGLNLNFVLFCLSNAQPWHLESSPDIGMTNVIPFCLYCSSWFILFSDLLSPGDNHGICTQTLELGMMRQMFYHCVPAVDNDFYIFSLLVTAVAAGIKPLTLGWWDKCSTIVFLLLIMIFTFWASLYQWQLWHLDSNPWWCDDEISVTLICCSADPLTNLFVVHYLLVTAIVSGPKPLTLG